MKKNQNYIDAQGEVSISLLRVYLQIQWTIIWAAI